VTEPYRRKLQVHCYRMMGSFQDAEDALQDTLLAAWQGLEGFQGRASIRTWLCRIATNRCLNVRRSASRRRRSAARSTESSTCKGARYAWNRRPGYLSTACQRRSSSPPEQHAAARKPRLHRAAFSRVAGYRRGTPCDRRLRSRNTR
jgi:RNA polymerase sigma factor (sigma-70 family)